MTESNKTEEVVSEVVAPPAYDDYKHDAKSHNEKSGDHALVVGKIDPTKETASDIDVHDKNLSEGVAKVEAAQAVWGKRGYIFMLGGIWMSMYAYSLDGSTTFNYLQYATSSFSQHSMLGTVSTAGAIIISIGKPFMAKLADYIGRGETICLTVVFYLIGYILYASSQGLNQYAAGNIIYSLGYTGLNIVNTIVLYDSTTLRYRAFAAGMINVPWIINAFAGSAIAGRILDSSGWRWGYGMFAILLPACLVPIVGSLLWGQWKARKLGILQILPDPEKDFIKHPFKATKRFVKEVDIPGLILVGAALALILLPLQLAPKYDGGWQNPSYIAMLVVGCVLVPVFCVWELWLAERFGFLPICPIRFFKNGNIAAAVLINFFDFVSFYLQYLFQYSFILVAKDWTATEMSLFGNIQTVALCLFGLISGTILIWWKRPKWLMVAGLLIRLLGVGIMINARGALGGTAELVWCQLLQGWGGGFASTISGMMASAMVPHTDMAVVVALVNLFAEIGNGIGTSIATAVWNAQMPGELAAHMPTNNATLVNDFFNSATLIASYPLDDPLRQGAIIAYGNVMRKLCIGATVVAVVPPIIAYFMLTDIELDNTQNKFDNRDLTGKVVEEAKVVEFSANKGGAETKHADEKV
ncbi:major facilitator superfamily domain-containing protein [Fennellomyces sp. T-0311]|nr:major facilitator superfamily domain-containing protein [Fennellomyces sp. T-0311]